MASVATNAFLLLGGTALVAGVVLLRRKPSDDSGSALESVREFFESPGTKFALGQPDPERKIDTGKFRSPFDPVAVFEALRGIFERAASLVNRAPRNFREAGLNPIGQKFDWILPGPLENVPESDTTPTVGPFGVTVGPF